MDRLSEAIQQSRQSQELALIYQMSESKGLDAIPITYGNGDIRQIIAIRPPSSLAENFEQVVEACRSLLLADALRIVRDHDLAEDVVQEALIRAYVHVTGKKNLIVQRNRLRSLPMIEDDGKEHKTYDIDIEKPIPWLRVVVSNMAKNHCISKKIAIVRLQGKMREEIEQELEDLRFEQPEQAFLRAERDDILWNLVETLPSRMKTAIKLRYLSGDDYQIIAQKLECPINTVRSDLRRAPKMLKRPMRKALGIEDKGC